MIEEEDCESDRNKMEKKGLTAAVTGRTDINYHLSRRMEISEHVCYNLHICYMFFLLNFKNMLATSYFCSSV